MLKVSQPSSSTEVLTAPEAASESALATFPWAYETGSFDALGHRFRIRTSNAAVGRHLEELFSSFLAADGIDDAVTAYSLIDQAQAIRPYALYADTERLTLADRASWTLGCLVWHINQQVIHRHDGLVLVHAGAVALDGVGVLLPGGMEAGKTTLTAGLLQAGCDYLTDEAAAIEPSTYRIVPYAKPLSVDAGSWDVLSDLRPPALDGELGIYHAQQWQVNAQSIRATAVSEPTQAKLIVSPRYVNGAATQVEQITRAEMLCHLVDTTFRFRTAGRFKFEVLGGLVARCSCYRLTVGELDKACALVLQLVDDVNNAGSNR